MIRKSWTQAASIEETLALWAPTRRQLPPNSPASPYSEGNITLEGLCLTRCFETKRSRSFLQGMRPRLWRFRAWRSRAAGAQLEHHGGRFQGRALLGYPRITDFADSRLAHRSAERSAQTSEADSRCCRLRRVRLAHGICVHAGHERCAARENVRLQGWRGIAADVTAYN